MSTAEEIEGRLADRVDEPLPESWIPKEAGARLIGRVRRYEKGTTQGYGDAPICVVESLRTEGRLASVWIFHTVLVNAFKRLQPKRGEVILVEYRGKIQPDGGGSAYHDWRLIVDRPAGAEGLDFGDAFGVVPVVAPVIIDGAHTTHDPPVDWNTTGNADERDPGFDGFTGNPADDDIPF